MSIINNFIGLFTKTNRSIGGVVIDATVRERHRSELKITEFPVEVGANINDHRIILPKELEIFGVVSNLPAGLLKFQVPSFGAGTPQTRAVSAYEALLKLQQDGEPINVQTGLKLYKNMLLKGVDVERDKDTAGGLYFSARLKEVIIISNSYTTIPSGKYKSGPTREQASKTEERGRQQPKQPANSIAFDLFKGVGIV